MNKSKNRRKQLFANKIHKQIFILVTLAALVPTVIVTICLYYLIFGITAMQLGIPEAIAYNILPAAEKVLSILLIAAPIAIAVILITAHRMTHTIVGPYDRIVRELDEHIAGKREGKIIIRSNDKFLPLVERINKLLSMLKNR